MLAFFPIALTAMTYGPFTFQKGVLKVQGGASLVTSVNGMLYHVMTDGLAKCFTYKGVPARNKFTFKDSRLDKLIFGK